MPHINPQNSFSLESGINLQTQITTLNIWSGNSTGLYYPLIGNPSGFLTNATVGGVNQITATGTIDSGTASGNVIFTGIGNITVSTGVNKSILISGNTGAYTNFALKSETGQFVTNESTGQLTNVFYPLNSNPSNYLTNATVGGVRMIVPTGTVQSGNISGNVILTGGGNVTVFTGISGHIVVSGNTGAYANFTTPADTGLLVNTFYPLNSNPSNYLTVSSNVGVRMIVPTGTTQSGQISGNVIITGAGTVTTYTGISGLVIISGTAGAPGGAAGVNSIAVTGITNTGYFTGDVMLSGAGNITVSTGTPLNKLIVISGNTGDLVNYFYPLNTNPSGYVRNISGSLIVTGTSGILDGQLLIGSTGENAFIQGNLGGVSGIFVVSGSGSLLVGVDSSIVRTSQTGGFTSIKVTGSPLLPLVNLTGAGNVSVTTGDSPLVIFSGNTGAYANFVSLSQTGGFLTLGNVGGVRMIVPTGTANSGNISGNVIVTGAGNVSVFTGISGYIVISGAAGPGSAAGVTTLAATGTTNTGYFTGDVMLSGAGSIVVSTGDQTSKVIVISGSAGSSVQVTGASVSSPNFTGAGSVTVTTGGGGLVIVSGNTTGVSSLNKMWIPAAAMTPSQVTGATTGQIFTQSSGHTIDTLNFLSGSGQSAYFNLSFPQVWDKSVVTPVFYWTTTGNAGTITWGIAGANIDDGTRLDILFNQGYTITDSTVSGNYLHQTTGAPLTLSGTLADDDQCYFKVHRVSGGTLADEAKLIGVGLAYTQTGMSSFTVGGQGSSAGVSSIIATGSINTGFFTGNIKLSGAGANTVFTGEYGLIIISGTSSPGGAAGVNTIGATGITNTGYFTGDILFSGAGNVVASTGNNNNKLIVISGDTGAYANFVSLSQTGGFLTLGNVGGVRTLQTTGTYPSGIVSGNVILSGISTISVTTGAAGQIVFSGDTGAYANFVTLSQTGNVVNTSQTGGFASIKVTGSPLLPLVNLTGAGNVTVATGDNPLVIISGNTGAYANFITPSQTGGFVSFKVTGSPLLSLVNLTGAGSVTVSTGELPLVIISGSAAQGPGGSAGVSTIGATGITNTGYHTGDVLFSGAGNIVVSTGTPINKLIVVSGDTGTYANFVTTGYLFDSGRKYNHQSMSFWHDYGTVTGLNLQEYLIPDNLHITGLVIRCHTSGAGGAHLISGASGAVLQYQMKGIIYQRTTGATKVTITEFSFNSGLLYQNTSLPHLLVSGGNNVGYDLYSGLSGCQGLLLGVNCHILND